MIRTIGMMLMMMACFGCQPLVDSHQGIDVEVYPVIYLLSVRADFKQNDSDIRQVWQQFLARHQRELFNGYLDFRYAGKSGEKTARRWRDELIALGADATKLQLLPDAEPDGVDLQVRLVVYQTAVPLCDSPGVGDSERYPMGCFVDSAGWLSLAHPEEALPGSVPWHKKAQQRRQGQ
ncbi:hypothetical protein VA7868_03098 [Vibrio aerogenes CECT 7868]|uniref:Uncharacterized protein n=1 Tax=Vibrio aerogenes CECT 7868 TaxID=1216006 RepID=A0A1M5ZRD5_9VIBR|nr:hypothetical protein [Vibrio aerogenes]SHI26764.1 hypothetical protein VA7868_03098 [Vibrio aerogenes CECT 7868]